MTIDGAGADDPAPRDVCMLTEASAFDSCSEHHTKYPAKRRGFLFMTIDGAGADDPAPRDVCMLTEASACDSCSGHDFKDNGRWN